MYDYLIVGAGFSGAVLAERLANVCGKRVLIIDKRNHIGGNAYDYYNEEGVLVHKYGPHIFHTNAEWVWNYLNQFTQFRHYEHRCLSSINGTLYPFPINVDTVNRFFGVDCTTETVAEFLRSKAVKMERAKNSRDNVIRQVGIEMYKAFFEGYTRKQWGLDPRELDASVTARIPVRHDHDSRYFTDKFQGVPRAGYTRMFENMLDHKNIHILLGADFKDLKRWVSYSNLIYTGPIDTFFDYCYGFLPYRSLRFTHKTFTFGIDEMYQQAGQVNYPLEKVPYTRVTEFKHLTGQRTEKTTIAFEYPTADGDPYYPVPRPQNREKYRLYEAKARELENVHFVGRLARYQYYNMDQAVAAALVEFDRIRRNGA